MNEKNYDYLKNQVKFRGFGEGLDKELREMMESQKPEFRIGHIQKFGTDETNSTLHFKKSAQSDMYFFNSYDLSVKQSGSDERLQQTYFINKDNDFTLKERFNMLQGRAVYKEFNRLEQAEGDSVRFKPTGETYMAWAETNFKQTDTLGNFQERKLFGFELEKTLIKYPIKELQDDYDKSRLIASLEKGNLQKATMEQDGKEVKVSIAANPRNKSLNFYDDNMLRMEVKPVQAIKQGEEQSQDIKSDAQQQKQKNAISQEDSKNNKQVESRRRSVRVSN